MTFAESIPDPSLTHSKTKIADPVPIQLFDPLFTYGRFVKGGCLSERY
jgi:hypothetical protein